VGGAKASGKFRWKGRRKLFKALHGMETKEPAKATSSGKKKAKAKSKKEGRGGRRGEEEGKKSRKARRKMSERMLRGTRELKGGRGKTRRGGKYLKRRRS